MVSAICIRSSIMNHYKYSPHIRDLHNQYPPILLRQVLSLPLAPSQSQWNVLRTGKLHHSPENSCRIEMLKLILILLQDSRLHQKYGRVLCSTCLQWYHSKCIDNTNPTEKWHCTACAPLLRHSIKYIYPWQTQVL